MGIEGHHCRPYVEVFDGLRVIFSHSCECCDYVAGSAVASGPRRQVGKGQLGQVVSVVRVPTEEVTQWLSSHAQQSAQGWAYKYQMHWGAQQQGAGAGGRGRPAADIDLAQEPHVFWPVVSFSNKLGVEARLVVPHITMRESRWKGADKAMASVAFFPLHLGYAVNCQQLQGMTFLDRLLYLLADITEAYWLQGLAAVMVTRVTEFSRLLFKLPQRAWARAKTNWFKIDPRVLDWLQSCRQTGFASGHD